MSVKGGVIMGGDVPPPSSNPIWTEGEPAESGYYLILVCGGSENPNGCPWVFLSRVIVDQAIDIMPIYMDHHGGTDRWRQYTGGTAMAYCDPTPENFASAFEEVKNFHDEMSARYSARTQKAGLK